MRDFYVNPATTHALARHRDLLAEAERARRFALIPPARAAGTGAAAALRHAVASLGVGRSTPSQPPATSAAT